MNIATMPAIASWPTSGSTGMLWYVPSSVNHAATAAGSPSSQVFMNWRVRSS